ncbi:LADA_0D10792g1_1 [Lachancea dasiensis]|uniref:Non-structural maintenance of chromosomes element 1 homolog n=1 Tax=Lachancea dasiensis TaxID=1072105 RepID=A0A1G4J7U8_9SACH|nr:LADA_0D10792g1_1 [Lachancea dasiensis]
MEGDPPEVSKNCKVLSEDDKNKYLLQYLLLHRGSCEEYQLLEALKTLDDSNDSGVESWEVNLKNRITNINISLRRLDYKVIRQMGRLGAWSYVYVDLAPGDDTKLATAFKPDDLKFVQWAINKFLGEDTEPQVVRGVKSKVENAVDQVLSERFGESHFAGLNKRVFYTCGSSELCQCEIINALQAEKVLSRLCQLRWFYESSQGRFGLDVRALAELQEYIKGRFDIPNCVVCNDLTLEGAMCQCSESAWHVTCLRHFLTHVGDTCQNCGGSMKDAIYMA